MRGDGIATIHQCTAQWPGYFAPAWEWIESVLRSDDYGQVRERAISCVDDFVDSIAYRPRLEPDDLRDVGIEDDGIEELRDVFEWFRHGPPRTVIRTLPLYAATVDSSGPRSV